MTCLRDLRRQLMFPCTGVPRSATATYLGSLAHHGNDLAVEVDAVIHVAMWAHKACLLYTSPSPRD
eukprot:11795487-Alexandrium_andersonii.AAC.1